MDFGFTDDQREIQRTARSLLAERAKPERVREHAEARTTDTELWKELCELGWPGIAISEEYGGGGLGRIELSILCEELGRAVAPVPFLPSAMASTMIEHAGSPEQRERWLPGPGLRSIVRSPRQRQRRHRGAGGRSRRGGRDRARRGRRQGPAGGRGRRRAHPLDAIDPTRSAARVRAQGGEELPGDVAGGVDRALVAISSELVGVCDRALEMTVAYVKDRKQFGVPVGAFQAVSHRCAQMLLDTEKARAATAFAAWSADADPDGLPGAAAMAKAAASDAGREVTASAIQAHGGIGFTWEADVHWLFKRAQLDAAMLGGGARQRAHLAAILAEQLSAPAPA